MFDTHCHLNFQAFEESFSQVIKDANSKGVSYFMIPGTDFETSRKATQIAKANKNVFASVGIHPTKDLENSKLQKDMEKIKKLAKSGLVCAIGETGLDLHWYRADLGIQKKFFESQIKIAVRLKKSLIVHNRSASKDVVKVLSKNWDSCLENHAVFHCCEVDTVLLDFAKENKMFIGIDGDVTYDAKKQAFVRKAPLETIVLETDSPYLTPEPLRSQKVFSPSQRPNKPENLRLISEFVARLKGVPPEKLEELTLQNSKTLYQL